MNVVNRPNLELVVSGFSVARSSPLEAVSDGGKIHLIGVCGVAMAPLAVLLSRQGYQVSGSDREFYEPMGSLLKNSRVVLQHGYDAKHITPDLDLVIIGNAARSSNPEVEATSVLRLRYSLFPKLLSDLVIDNKLSVVVAGTHGKSTTSALLAKVFSEGGLSPSYFFGAQSLDFPLNAHIDAGNIAVVEGDEYDSAFFAKFPKFHFYRPNILVITSIEFDHADIYSDLQAILAHFRFLLEAMPANGLVVACADYEPVRSLLKEFTGCRVVTYGMSDCADVKVSCYPLPAHQEVQVQHRSGEVAAFTTPLAGAYNALNCVAALLVAQDRGILFDDIKSAFSRYQGLMRRQQVRFVSDRLLLIDDFAHHPTAVKATLLGLRQKYKEWRISAVFEPRSNTSRRKVFQREYQDAFGSADEIFISSVVPRVGDEGIELMDTAALADSLCRQGKVANEFPDVDSLYQSIIERIAAEGDGVTENPPRRLIVIMSNGSFGGLTERLDSFMRSRATQVH